MKKVLATMIIITMLGIISGCGNDPKEADHLLKSAGDSFSAQEFDKAKRIYTKIVENHPKTDAGRKAAEILNGYDQAVEKAKEEIAAKKAAEEKAEAERKEAERKAYEEKIKPPVKLSNLIIEKDMIGTPEVSLIMTNTSNKIIDAYKVKIYAYDNYGKQLKEFGHGDDYFAGISQNELQPGATTSSDYHWSLMGFSNGRKFKLVLYSIHFTDDTTWESVDGQEVSISGKM